MSVGKDKTSRDVISGDMTLNLECNASDMLKRMPFAADGISCECGGQSFYLGVAANSKPCPRCRSHAVQRCRRCGKWFCTTCLVRQVVRYRRRAGEENLGRKMSRGAN